MPQVVDVKGLRRLEKQLTAVAKRYKMDTDELKRINETAGNMFSRAMQRKVKSYDRDIIVTNGEGRKRIVVKKGTYKRSMAAWLIEENNNAVWAGPRTGRKVAKTKRAWFAYIVESDQQFIKGSSRNAGVIAEVIKSRRNAIEAWRLKQFKAYQAKIENEIKRIK